MDQIKTGQFIKAVRKERSMTQQELADKLYISEKTVSKWENGRCLPETAILPELAKALYERVVEKARALGVRVETGEFGEHMHVLVENDGPVNIIIDTEKIGK